jgi:hypothetical protein
MDLIRHHPWVDDASATLTFSTDWAHRFDGFPHGCALGVCAVYDGGDVDFADALDWQRVRHREIWAYTIADDHRSFAMSIATVPFRVCDTSPLELSLRHDYGFDNPAQPFAQPGSGAVEISGDGGDWQAAEAWLTTGAATFLGVSGTWRTDRLAFASALAGHQVQLRLHATANNASRVEIRGAMTPIFNTVHTDG